MYNGYGGSSGMEFIPVFLMLFVVLLLFDDDGDTGQNDIPGSAPYATVQEIDPGLSEEVEVPAELTTNEFDNAEM